MEAIGIHLPWEVWACVTAVGIIGLAVSFWADLKKKKSALGPEIRLNDTTTYREQPDGSRVVTQTTLAKPVRVSGVGVTGGAAPAGEYRPASPGAGRNAAKAATLDDAREIWGDFLAAPDRRETNWAYWAFISRLEEAGRGDETADLILDLFENDEDIDPTEEIEATIKEWRDAR